MLRDRVGLIQIDSVNVLVRSQELPLFARLGPHPRDLLPRLTADGELFEYWCHEASLLPIDMWPLLRWKAERVDEAWGSIRAIGRDEPGYVETVLDEVRERGPLTAGELSAPGPKTESMWGWSPGKRALEHLFRTGAVTARRRASDFARLYDLTERVIPADILALPVPSEDEAKRERVFGFRYRIGIYTPAARREHGYYVLPFLLGDRLVARVDLKADRGGSALLVQSAHAEPGHATPEVAAELAPELAAMAGWLGLETVRVAGAGDLAAPLAAMVRA